ncbi:MAG: YggS family pyridoxal phosphate-dependent enzyme [Cyclobacteriaceae bacterium]|nr:YggS family pyridoxal phosphate-dependent enzyme [Cyclobacteriaceae bacterium SS2]
MSQIQDNINRLKSSIADTPCKLVAISKTKPSSDILEAYEAGQRLFGENKVQELTSKYEELPKDIEWHMVGHLQRNKVKYMAPFVNLIHSIDSLKLLKEVNKQAEKANRTINCLLQVHIAEESTKFGFDLAEIPDLIQSDELKSFDHIQVVGLMGMATFTEDETQIKREFTSLRKLFDQLKSQSLPDNVKMSELSMGMSGDYPLALECGSTMIRVGSSIFGERNYV